MTPRLSTWIARAFALMLMGLLVACGNHEPEERAAFIAFLQTRVLDRPGVHIPKPTEEQKKSFGRYAQDYAIITDFNAARTQASKQLDDLATKGSVRSLADIVARRDELRGARKEMQQLDKTLDEDLAKADAARARLKQPDDLKAVFDKAYDKTVTIPATVSRDVFPAMDAVFDGVIRIGDYVDAHKSQIEISGSILTVSDPKVLNELNGMLKEFDGHTKAIQAALHKLNTAGAGS